MLRTISPRYMPEIIFSKACLRLKRINTHRERTQVETRIRIDGFAIELCVELRQRENFSMWANKDGKEDCLLWKLTTLSNAPHSQLIIIFRPSPGIAVLPESFFNAPWSSTYAPFVPVPKIAPSKQLPVEYAPLSRVPTV